METQSSKILGTIVKNPWQHQFPFIAFNSIVEFFIRFRSLINVNEWNEKLLKSLPENQRHDIAIWLTRLNIGGPSGYAPVDGICDPARSCSLNRYSYIL